MRWTRTLGRLGACLALAWGTAQAQQPGMPGWQGPAPGMPYAYPQQQVGLPAPPGPPPGPPPVLSMQNSQFNPIASGPAGPLPAQHVVPRQPGAPPAPPVNVPTPPASLGKTDANPEGKPLINPHAPPHYAPADCPPPVVMQECPVDGFLVKCPCVYPQMIGAPSLDYFYRPLLHIRNPGRLTAYQTVEPRSPFPQASLPPAVLANFPRSPQPGQTFGLPPGTGLVALPGPQVFPGEVQTVMRVAIPTRGAWRIGDNESPQPQDRVYLNYNYFQDVGDRINEGLVAAFGQPNGQYLQANGNTVLVPLQPPRMTLHQGTIGVEKTIPHNENASVGVRIPVYGVRNGAGLGDENISDADVGDISVILKVALANELAYCGFLASTGVVVTIPTGPLTNFDDENINNWVFQPFVGGLWDLGPAYVQGFGSVAIPGDGPEPILAFGDLGIGWWAYRSEFFFLSAVVPTVEAHMTIPLTHRNSPDAAVRSFDQLTATAGVHFVLGPYNSTFSIGGAAPCFAPRPFDFELIAQFNYRF